ncbi:hypothetical protein ARMSODRAFT_479259 [Armillaria solidipes]|uniref:Uncharacterized protein n=1 Tax=Armillaria solidipes TaxID=1076256 RepID=A0A2H3B021_9AGAR|nr:hypothetical protein ARMSODRAFT_479259 [Armillaria solidipes]
MRLKFLESLKTDRLLMILVAPVPCEVEMGMEAVYLEASDYTNRAILRVYMAVSLPVVASILLTKSM